MAAKPGTSDDNSVNAESRCVANLAHPIMKCFSSSTGPGDGDDGVDPGDGDEAVPVLGGKQYEQVLLSRGVTGLVQRPLSIPRK